ncbi:MAG: indole-3-glycerol-phosphate synthase [Prevotella sp.]|nr:indole-3-glycerol-phosphate synthase [Prevotella sp.]
MQDILQTIIEHKHHEVEALRAACSPVPSPVDSGTAAVPAPSSAPPSLRTAAVPAPPSPSAAPPSPSAVSPSPSAASSSARPSLRAALLSSPTGIIAEFKRRSPSKGWINEGARPDVVPLAYQHAGAAALSILTDEHFFGGSDDFIRTARRSGVTIPILYKNFVIDELQLHAAARCGASATLLIAACLSKERCRDLIRCAHDLGLEVLLEMHDERELEYATLGADLCGINNRHLGSFHTDVSSSFLLAERLRSVCGFDTDGATTGGDGRPVLVSESGIGDAQTVRDLRAAGFRGFLMGEHFMKAADPAAALHTFLHQLSDSL